MLEEVLIQNAAKMYENKIFVMQNVFFLRFSVFYKYFPDFYVGVLVKILVSRAREMFSRVWNLKHVQNVHMDKVETYSKQIWSFRKIMVFMIFDDFRFF